MSCQFELFLSRKTRKHNWKPETTEWSDSLLQHKMSNEETPRQQAEQVVEQDQSEQVSVQQNASAEQTNSQQIEELTNQHHACQVELDALKERLTQIIQENSCPICLFPWKEQGAHRLVSLRCGHLFGDVCIRRWMSRNSWCPNCRQEGEITDLRYIYGRRILPCPVQQDQAVQPSQVEQSFSQGHASRIQQTLNSLVQLARRFVSELQTSVEQQETLVQRRYLAVQQALYNVEEMAERMLLVVQSPLRGQHPAPQFSRAEEMIRTIIQEYQHEAEQALTLFYGRLSPVPMPLVARPRSRPVGDPPEANRAPEAERAVAEPMALVARPQSRPVRDPAEANRANRERMRIRYPGPSPQDLPASAEPMRSAAHRYRRRRVRDPPLEGHRRRPVRDPPQALPNPAARMPLIENGPQGRPARDPPTEDNQGRRFSVG